MQEYAATSREASAGASVSGGVGVHAGERSRLEMLRSTQSGTNFADPPRQTNILAATTRTRCTLSHSLERVARQKDDQPDYYLYGRRLRFPAQDPRPSTLVVHSQLAIGPSHGESADMALASLAFFLSYTPPSTLQFERLIRVEFEGP